MFRFLSEIKDFFIEPVFSNWVGLSKIGRKLVVLEIRRHFRASIFSLKFEIFFQKKNESVFLFICVHWLFSNCLLAMFYEIPKIDPFKKLLCKSFMRH